MAMQRKVAGRVVAVMTGLAVGAMMTGCGIGAGSGVTIPTEIHGSSIHGTVFGGQQPVVGASIKLYMAGTGGYGVAPTYTTGTGNMLTVAVTSGPGGAFDVTGDYTCLSASTQVYLVATGGNSGYTTNNRIALMAALGSCGNLMASTSVNINEITTVASVYSLASFMSGIANISTSATNGTGLINAFADVNLLSNVATGATPGTSVPAGMTVPTSEINTLADIVATCINSGGGSYNDGSSCGTLFYNANPGGTSGTAPTDTITALMNIAQHPAISTTTVAALYALATPTSPFQPTLTTTPNDYTLALTMVPSGLYEPTALAADASGNIFIANMGLNSVEELSHGGATLIAQDPVSSGATSLAIDANDVIWVVGSGGVLKLNGSTGAQIGEPLTGGGLNAPKSIAFDSLGNAWVANSGNASVTMINNAGTTLTNYTPAGATGPLAIGVNPH